jgi:hypothetical protein
MQCNDNVAVEVKQPGSVSNVSAQTGRDAGPERHDLAGALGSDLTAYCKRQFKKIVPRADLVVRSVE